MNLDFSDDQKYLKEEARKFFEKENTLKATRKTLEDKLFIDQDLWNKVVALGWTGITIPEEYDEILKAFIYSNPSAKTQVHWSRADNDQKSAFLTFCDGDLVLNKK